MNRLMEKVLFLEKVQIFQNLSLEELSQIAQITVTEIYEEGETLFRQGDPGNYAYIVNSGLVRLVLEQSSGKQDVLSTLVPGSCFGEMALFDGQSRSATALIIEKSYISSISREDFMRLLVRYPSISLGIIAQLSFRIREGNEQLNHYKTLWKDFLALYNKLNPILGKKT